MAFGFVGPKLRVQQKHSRRTLLLLCAVLLLLFLLICFYSMQHTHTQTYTQHSMFIIRTTLCRSVFIPNFSPSMCVCVCAVRFALTLTFALPTKQPPCTGAADIENDLFTFHNLNFNAFYIMLCRSVVWNGRAGEKNRKLNTFYSNGARG